MGGVSEAVFGRMDVIAEKIGGGRDFTYHSRATVGRYCGAHIRHCSEGYKGQQQVLW